MSQIKSVVEFSNVYREEVGGSMFHYPDTATGSVIQNAKTLRHGLMAKCRISHLQMVQITMMGLPKGKYFLVLMLQITS